LDENGVLSAAFDQVNNALRVSSATSVAVVIHGSTANTSRPAGPLVRWVGSVAPTNAATNDLWDDTSTGRQFRYTGTLWKSEGLGPLPQRRDTQVNKVDALLSQPVLQTIPATMFLGQSTSSAIQYANRALADPGRIVAAPAAGSVDAGPIAVYGGMSWGATAAPFADCIAAPSITGQQQPQFWEFVTDEPTPELLVGCFSGWSVRAMINGQWIGTSLTALDYAPAITQGGSKQRLVIINNKVAPTTLSADCASGQRDISIPVAPAVGDTITVDPNTATNSDQGIVTAVSGAGPYTVTCTWTLAAAGNLSTAHLTGAPVYISTRQFRRYKIMSNGVPIKAVTVGMRSTVYRPPDMPRIRVAWLMDSFGSNQSFDGIAHVACRALGWDVLLMNGVGGTGYTADGGLSAAYTAASRIDALVATLPDVAILYGSVNDGSSGATMPQVTAAATTCINKMRAGSPRTTLIVAGPANVGTANQAAIVAVTAAVASAAASAGVPFIDQSNYVFGSGKIGTPAYNGNADIVTSADGTHPGYEGCKYEGLRLAMDIAAALSV
jgi:hypothetical protein